MAVYRHEGRCTDAECKVCLDDHIALGEELYERTGVDRKAVDILGHYHSWCKRTLGSAETPYGWATQAVFDEQNIAAYVADWLDDGGEAA